MPKFQLSKHLKPLFGDGDQSIDLKSRGFLLVRKMTLEQSRSESSHNLGMKSSEAEFF